MRKIGPEIDTAATTRPLKSRIGAAMQVTPGVRSSIVDRLAAPAGELEIFP